MPVVPSFSGYAQKPDLAGASAAGQNIVLKRQEIANQAQQAAAQLANERARIAAQERMAAMQIAASREQQAREQQLAEAKLNIQQAYQQQQIGLEKMGLDIAAQRLMMDAQRAMEAPFEASGRTIDVGGSQIPVVEVERGRYVIPPPSYADGAGGGELSMVPVPGAPGYGMVQTPGGKEQVIRLTPPPEIEDAIEEMKELESSFPGVRTGQRPDLNKRRREQWDAARERYETLRQQVETYRQRSQETQGQPQQAPPPGPQGAVATPRQVQDPYFGDVAGSPPMVTQGSYYAGSEEGFQEKRRQKPRKVGDFEIISVQ